MSVPSQTSRLTVRDIRKGGIPSVWLTAYTTPIARLLDPHVDVLLVGDSLGMVLYGFDTTLPVTLDMMIGHGGAVMRGSHHALVVVDLPFGYYQGSPEQAFRSASRIMSKTGCSAVKLEGGREMEATIRFLVERGIPVCGHVGLKPQSVQADGGFHAKGRTARESEQVMADAQAVSDAGAFAIVLEGTVEPLARTITTAVQTPIIGIGASPECDGQVLVIDDVIGTFNDFKPRFVKRYADLSPQISEAAAAYAEEVRARRFPSASHCFGTKS